MAYARRLKGRRVAIVDDVVSTGGSLKAIEELMEMAGAEAVCRYSPWRSEQAELAAQPHRTYPS